MVKYSPALARANRKRIALLFAADACQSKNSIDLLLFARSEGYVSEGVRADSSLHAEFQRVIADLFVRAERARARSRGAK